MPEDEASRETARERDSLFYRSINRILEEQGEAEKKYISLKFFRKEYAKKLTPGFDNPDLTEYQYVRHDIRSVTVINKGVEVSVPFSYLAIIDRPQSK